MAKFVHTSDWHIGHQFHNYDRTAEHQDFFRQLADIVGSEQPDALLVSGDVFDSQIPSSSAMTLFTEGLHSVKEAAPEMKIIVIAGNHDSASRLEINRVLWKHFGVEIIGSVHRRPDGLIDFSRHVIPVTRCDGSVTAYVVAIPHLSRGAYPAPAPDAIYSPERRREIFFKEIGHRLEQLRAGHTGATLSDPPVIAMAHFTLSGCDVTGHDREVIGNLESTDASQFPIDCDYLALGHIHRPQTLRPHDVSYIARYSGSPIPISFDESYPHSVTIIETDAHGTMPEIREITIKPSYPVLTLPAHGEAYTDFNALLKAVGTVDSPAYIRARLKVADEAPANAYEEVIRAADSGSGRFCVLQIINGRTDPETDDTLSLSVSDVESLRALSPTELASRYYHALYGSDMPSELTGIFNDCVQAVANDSDNTD